MVKQILTNIQKINALSGKTLLVLLAAAFFSVAVRAQSPEIISYQAVIRDVNNELAATQEIGMQISILQGSSEGEAVYVENHTQTTNANGLVTIEIGTGTSGDDFSSIDWSAGPYFIKTETDPFGGSDYTITGTSQLLSVPYAMHARTAEDITGEITEDRISDLQNYLISETDPVFTSWDKSTGIEISESQISDLKNYLTGITGQPMGDLADVDLTELAAGRVLKYDADEAKWIVADLPGITEESDPLFTASPASDIETSDIEDWKAAWGWGDHSEQGYLSVTGIMEGRYGG